MENLVFLFIGLVVGVVLMTMQNQKTYFNSNIEDSTKNIFIPTFTVTEIELDYDKEHRKVARYTVTNSFFAKENHKSFNYQKFYFYDKYDKYKIGDEISFVKLNVLLSFIDTLPEEPINENSERKIINNAC